MDGLLPALTEKQRAMFTPVPVPLKAGYATFHHPLLIHGSYANTTERQRRAFVVNVFADGTRSNTNEPLLSGIPVFAKDKKLEGDFFPLLFDPVREGI
jgi:ectoine hydroxylase-related dioxygenase (phytanoyl-CoA dioxygenase family)